MIWFGTLGRNWVKLDNIFCVREKVAVITGGMGQLGMCYVHALIDGGAKVAVFDLISRPNTHHEWFEKYLQSDNLSTYKVDVTNRNQIERAAKEVFDHWGTIDILINNAALDSPPDAPTEEVGPFETYPEGSFNQVMDVNVKGAFLCCQVIGGIMAKQGRGVIVNISSIYGAVSPRQNIYDFRRKGGATYFKPVAYSVSKSAIFNLTRYLATYWAENGVRVNTLTLSGIFNNQPEEFLNVYNSHVPLGRMAQAEEVVGPMLFLVSNASSYMTGANLVIDGGWTAW